MSERAMIFSAPMVRAARAGQKTQTRRVVKSSNSTVLGRTPNHKRRAYEYLNSWAGLDFSKAFTDGNSAKPPEINLFGLGHNEDFSCGRYLHVPLENDERSYRVRSRIEPGDQLWVRETFAFVWPNDFPVPNEECNIEYRADTDNAKYPGHWDDAEPDDAKANAPRWKSPIFMPRWAGRISLQVTSVRVQHVQDISEEDAKVEGIIEPAPVVGAWRDPKRGREGHWSYRKPFSELWDSINDKRGYGWNANPWVWVIIFSVHQDAMTIPASQAPPDLQRRRGAARRRS